MAIGILGRKVGMTQIFDEAGNVVPVTVIEAGPCHVLQVRTEQRDGYEAIQLGFLDKPRRLASRSQRGHVARLDSKRSKRRGKSGVEALAKAGCEPKRFVRELAGPAGDRNVGDKVGVDIFRPTLDDLPGILKQLAAKHKIETEQLGWQEALKKSHAAEYNAALKSVKAVDVIGISKGRGYSGAMKRHNFHGQRASHGVKKCHRHIGGTAASAFPSRVFKGKKMAGHFGAERVTSRNLKVVRIDVENHLLLVRGAVPGPSGGYVMVRETNKL